MEGLIAAVSSLAVAVTGLGGVLWRLQKNGRNNGKHHAEEMRLLRSIDSRLEEAVRSRAESARLMEAHLAMISAGIEFLKGQRSGG